MPARPGENRFAPGAVTINAGGVIESGVRSRLSSVALTPSFDKVATRGASAGKIVSIRKSSSPVKCSSALSKSEHSRWTFTAATLKGLAYNSGKFIVALFSLDSPDNLSISTQEIGCRQNLVPCRVDDADNGIHVRRSAHQASEARKVFSPEGINACGLIWIIHGDGDEHHSVVGKLVGKLSQVRNLLETRYTPGRPQV